MSKASQLLESLDDFRKEFELQNRRSFSGYVSPNRSISVEELHRKHFLWQEVLKRIPDERVRAYVSKYPHVQRNIEWSWGAATPLNNELYIRKMVRKLESLLDEW